ncbi:biotin--[acetyl-CoA-carboxylase] ligase [Mesoterricola sediminis]|uniref:BPL/LPL catalytic domain-containing protein n=1 Tax=Mesoterricola sediminis TaxID=2927980 RepID=A0AA48HDQ8_9BACT|nr:hypothetical protein [Mesoterricola sediminis]BDU76383.1 hypothetical protein METESE_13410 [Mesoterricola sediminis]
MTLTLLRLATVDSTQAFLERHPELGFCGVTAGEQTQGRGQGGNGWESAPGAGLWLSAALPVAPLAPGILLQRAMGAVIEALEPCGLPLGLKWPNDLVAWKEGSLVKLGGILGAVRGGRLLLGVGVNLHRAPAIPGRAIPPAALADLAPGPVPDPARLAREVLDLWEDLDVVRPPAFQWPEPEDALAWEGGAGRCEAWLEDGRLAVRTAEGRVCLTAGYVRGARPDGRVGRPA